MTSLVFEIFGRDNGASRVFDNVGDASDRAGRRLRDLDSDTRVAGAGVGQLGGWFSNLAPAILPGVAAVGQLAGALVLLPAAAGAAATAIATLGIGLSSVFGALKAYGSAQDAAAVSAGKSAAQQMASANAIINAQEAVRDAIRGVADAQRNAAESIRAASQRVADAKQAEADTIERVADNNAAALRRVQDAEENLLEAQKRATRAQQDLNDAREEAKRSLEDLQNRVADQALAQRAAVLALQRAEQQLAATMADPTANMQARAQAQLTYDQAKQRLAEVSLSYERTKADAEAASKAGIEGSKQVTSAQEALVAAQKNVTTAQNDLAAAQREAVKVRLEGERAVAEATERVAEAQHALTLAQIEGAERVTRAQEAVVRAQRSLAQAIASAADSSASASAPMRKFNELMEKLSPAARELVQTLIGLGGAWAALRLDVQEHLLAGVAANVKSLAEVALPVLRGGLVGMADALNAGIHAFTEWATSSKTVADFKTMFTNFAAAGRELVGSLQPILDIFRDISVVGSEFLPGLAHGFATAMQHAAAFVAHARETGALRNWIQQGIDAARILGRILGDLVGIIATLAKSGMGQDLLTGIQMLTGGLRWLLENVPGLIPIIEAFIIAWKVQQIAGWIGSVTAGLRIWEMGTKAVAAAQLLLNLSLGPIGLIALAIAGLAAGVIYLWKTSDGFRAFMIGAWDAIKNAVSAAVDWIVGRFWAWVNNVRVSADMVKGAIGAAVDWIVGTFWRLIDNASKIPGMILNAVGDLSQLLYNTGKNIIIGLWNGIVSMWGWLKDRIIGFVRSAVPGPVLSILGIASPSRLFEGIGRNVARGLAEGISGGQAMVSAAATKLANATNIGLDALTMGIPTMGLGALTTGVPTPGGGTPTRGVLEIKADDSQLSTLIVTWLRNAIRAAGGDVQRFLGQSA